jgi:hypothetical protein
VKISSSCLRTTALFSSADASTCSFPARFVYGEHDAIAKSQLRIS